MPEPPNSDPPNAGPPNAGPPNSEDVRYQSAQDQRVQSDRRTRARALDRYRQERRAAQIVQVRRHRQATQQTLNGLMAEMDRLTDYGNMANTRAAIKRQRLRKWEQTASQFADAGPRDTIRYTVILLGCIGVISLNFFLINAPVNFIAGQVAAEEDSWFARMATVIVPCLLLVLEIYLSIQLHHARLQEAAAALAADEDEAEYQQFVRRGLSPVQKWQVAGMVMIIFTPAMIIGTMLAWEDWFASYRLVTTFGLIALAGVTDAAIVFGGEQILESLAFLEFHASRWRLQGQIIAWEGRYNRAGRQATACYTRYHQTLTNYNEAQPNHPLGAGPFRRPTAKFVNDALGYEAIAIQGEDPDPAAAGNLPRRPLPNPPPTPVMADEPVPDRRGPQPDADDTAAERDYYRNLVAAQARRAERELGPD
ncbi:hypothetical protein [Trichothermofontia sp.]